MLLLAGIKIFVFNPTLHGAYEFTSKASKWRNFEHIRMIMHIEKAEGRYKLLFSNAEKASSILARTLHTLYRAGVSVS